VVEEERTLDSCLRIVKRLINNEMAIKYAGDRNLIGYGAAQVYKEADLGKGIELEKRRQERARDKKAAAAAKKKEANDKALAALLKEQDLSKVRNADVDYLTNEFNDIISSAGSIVAKGENPSTNMELQKRLNEYRAKTNQSAMGRDAYDKNLKLTVENDDYKGSDNINALVSENESPMWGEGASYFDSEAQGEEGSVDYVAGAKGTQVTRLNPNLHVAEWEKEIADNIKPQDISMTADGRFTLPSSGGNYLTFTTKKDATDAQLEAAANDLYNNHVYSDDMKLKYKQLAIEAGYSSLDENDEEVPDVMGYLKNKVAGMVGEVETSGVKDIKPKGTYVSVNTAETQRTAAGEDIAPTSYEMPGTRNVVSEGGIFGYGKGKIQQQVVENLSYPNVDIPAVVDKDGKVITPKRTGQTFDFGGKPFNVSPEEASGFMVFGQSQEASDAGLNPGFSRSGQNIEFIPKSITFKPTATQDLEVEVDGVKQQFSKGEPLDQGAIDALSEKDREKLLENKPWLEGLEKYGTTLSIAFSPNVHRRFSTHVSFQNKRERAIYERIMKNIGVEPIKQK